MGVSQMKRAISQERRKQCIVECRNSGVPVKEWCRKQGISYLLGSEIQLPSSSTLSQQYIT